MADYRIFIVDDQREVRQMLRAAIDTIDSRYIVQDMPSGEEALLEAARRPVHLLISDIRLPGMSGFELIDKIQKRHPDLKIILITGYNDPQFLRQAARNSQVHFFSKPIDMPRFLHTVEKCLPCAEKTLIKPQPTQKVLKSTYDQLASLRIEAGALSVLLMELDGRILHKAGELPSEINPSDLFQSLAALSQSAARVSRALKSGEPQAVCIFRGAQHRLLISPVTPQIVLTALVKGSSVSASGKPWTEEIFEKLEKRIEAAIPDLRSSLASESAPKTQASISDSSKAAQPAIPAIQPDLHKPQGGAPPDVGQQVGQKIEAPGNTTPQIEGAAETELEAIFKEAQKSIPAVKDLDQFWEQANEQNERAMKEAAARSYEQARKLGFSPEAAI